MKIRIKGDSLRYRLTRPEVESFILTGTIKEETHFADKTLTYVLQRTDSEQIAADLTNNTITVYMPSSMVAEWGNTEIVGFENTDNILNIYIEKDFKCLDNVAEDQSDNYPNPLVMQNHE